MCPQIWVAKMIPKKIPSLTAYSQRLQLSSSRYEANAEASAAGECSTPLRPARGQAPYLSCATRRSHSPGRKRPRWRAVQAKAAFKSGPEWPLTTTRVCLSEPPSTNALGYSRWDLNASCFQNRARRSCVSRKLRSGGKVITGLHSPFFFFFGLSSLLTDPFYGQLGRLWRQIKGREAQKKNKLIFIATVSPSEEQLWFKRMLHACI